MSDPINANPTVLDVSELPKRQDTSTKNSASPHDKLVETILGLSLDSDSEADEASKDDDIDNDGELGNKLEYKYDDDDDEDEDIDSQEIFDLIATINDPEHPLTLAQLAVVNLSDITVTQGADKTKDLSEVLIKITPTITHCSLATLIGLGIRVRLERCLPPRFRIRILIKEGTHQSENQVNKQLNDKERVAAACENEQLLSVILQMLANC
ncbi:uncharacterized protein KQ657_002742 [Scheffersomyces spartinae]|uniref:MIP18 family-like domain-containing protein n=1 Tax=Scheffersomyces spartinae TaxID=45513 RepID=A0A9P7V5R4_9ASCO|nr:uncharacterized protein KQ657_002742 [Scheffersomyces spartinae]KAG7191777.1 hypothetical protein KQ657_002742 [Scheffersomyces spartinae]